MRIETGCGGGGDHENINILIIIYVNDTDEHYILHNSLIFMVSLSIFIATTNPVENVVSTG